MAGIPVIDLRKFEAEPEKLREASEKWGCFRVVNHGVPTKLMTEMKQVAKDLHDLPLEIKLRNIDVKLPLSGYTASSGNKPIYEALGRFDSTSSHSVSTFCAQLEASTLQRETIQKYFKAIYEVAIDVASKLRKSMGLANYCFDSWPCEFKINKYSPTKENVGSYALRIHTDSGFLNVLHDEENIGGLQVMDQHGTFVDVDPLPGSLFVNFGDMVVPWSNGRLPSAVHRVQCKGVGLRYTIATSLSPPPEQILEAPSEFIDADHPRLYTSFTYEEYRKLQASKDMHASEVLEVLRAENDVV